MVKLGIYRPHYLNKGISRKGKEGEEEQSDVQKTRTLNEQNNLRK